jgi:hypothetical protein
MTGTEACPESTLHLLKSSSYQAEVRHHQRLPQPPSTSLRDSGGQVSPRRRVAANAARKSKHVKNNTGFPGFGACPDEGFSLPHLPHLHAACRVTYHSSAATQNSTNTTRGSKHIGSPALAPYQDYKYKYSYARPLIASQPPTRPLIIPFQSSPQAPSHHPSTTHHQHNSPLSAPKERTIKNKH